MSSSSRLNSTPPTSSKILIVDDVPDNVRTLDAILGELHSIAFTTKGEETLALAESIHPDLILLDVMMPGLDGYSICQQLKSNRATADIPVIFISAMNEAKHEIEGLDAGAVDYITKPFHAEIVRLRVRLHLELKHQRDFLNRLSCHDGLTGLINKRHYEECFLMEWQRALRNRHPLSLLMMDIDHFKKFNDRNGHLEGDEALRQVTAAIADVFHRPADKVARIGGEELAALLPETDAAGALAMAARVLEAVNALKWRGTNDPPGQHVTVSIGAGTCLPSPSESSPAFIKRVDDALYAAKNSGRNRAEVAASEVETPRNPDGG